MAHRCFYVRATRAPQARCRIRQVDENLCPGERGSNHGNCRTVVADCDAVFASILMICKEPESRIIEQFRLRWKRPEDAFALPPADGGREIVRQPGQKKKPNMLLVEILNWYHRTLDCNHLPKTRARNVPCMFPVIPSPLFVLSRCVDKCIKLAFDLRYFPALASQIKM